MDSPGHAGEHWPKRVALAKRSVLEQLTGAAESPAHTAQENFMAPLAGALGRHAVLQLNLPCKDMPPRGSPAAIFFSLESSLQMQAKDFADFHEAALEADEIRHSLLLFIIAHLRSNKEENGVKAWTLGGPGECAMQTPGYPIVLGNLSKAQCHSFAEEMSGKDYHGVMGADDAALWFAERAQQLGAEFSEEVPQLIQALPKIPLVPSVPGFPRQLTLNEFRLFRVWTISFMNEAVPYDPIPSEEASMADLKSKRHWLWTLENRPVSIAAIGRRTRRTASINSVYTPPEHRNQGFGAAVTAIVARQIVSERRIACLYTDVRNAASNRCYAKLGFEAYCRSRLLIRSRQQRS